MNAVRLVPFALLAVGLVAVVWRRSATLLWAGLLLLVAYPVLVPEPNTPITPSQQAEWLVPLWVRGPWSLVPVAAGLFPIGGVHGLVVTCTMLAAIAVLTVFLADVHRRVPRPRDGRAALSALSGVALGMLGGICLYILAYAGYQRATGANVVTLFLSNRQWYAGPFPGVTMPLAVALALGFTAVAAFATPLLPLWLRAPVVLAAAVWLLAQPAQGATIPYPEISYSDLRPTLLTDVFRVCLVLLVLVALADPRVRWRTVATSAAVTVMVSLWLSWLTPIHVAFPTAVVWQISVLYPLTAAVLVLALWWAPVVIISAGRGWGGALLAFAAGLLWFALQLWWIFADHAALVGSLAAVMLVTIAGRMIVRRTRLRASGTAGSTLTPDGP
jgi:hypothetical protein